MDKVRKGEIALKLMEVLLAKKGAHVSASMMRELADIAKVTDIPLAELKVFAKEVVSEVVEKLFTQLEGDSKPTG